MSPPVWNPDGLRVGWPPITGRLDGLLRLIPPAFEQIVGGGHHLPLGIDLVAAAMPQPRPAELFHLAKHRLDDLAARIAGSPPGSPTVGSSLLVTGPPPTW